jgi:hypothetical protein
MQPRSVPQKVSLRAHIRRRLESGQLPVLQPVTISAGAVSRCRCDVCGEYITRGQNAYDIPQDGSVLLSVHLECYVLWQIECLPWVTDEHPIYRLLSADGGAPKQGRN